MDMKDIWGGLAKLINTYNINQIKLLSHSPITCISQEWLAPPILLGCHST